MPAEDSTAGLKNIPGVLGPIENPFERERRRLYADPVIDVPLIQYKSKYNPIPYLSSVFYYSFDYPLQVARRFFDSIRVVKPSRYYHQKFRRVPNIWECSTDDVICIYEAECQFRRDMKIDQEILEIVDRRVHVCRTREGENAAFRCKELLELQEQVQAAWKVKYGDIGTTIDAQKVLQKQKNRFIEDRYLARTNQKVAVQ
ncbi:NADH dehydrogenase [ubiquinone] 1 beta subcomplex subunit 10-like [Clavelina lepadiformis]